MNPKKIALEHVTPRIGEVRRNTINGHRLEVIGFDGPFVEIRVTAQERHTRLPEDKWIIGVTAAEWCERVRMGTYK